MSVIMKETGGAPCRYTGHRTLTAEEHHRAEELVRRIKVVLEQQTSHTTA